MSMMGWAVVAVVAVVAFAVSRNFDGPAIHWAVTILAAWLAYKYVRTHSMMGGT